MGFKEDRETRRRAHEKKKELYGEKKSACKSYGCNWSRNVGKSLKVKSGYVVQKCKWCGRERVVRRPRF